jgi:hypothetical protein
MPRINDSPVGQAVEMDATTGNPSPSHPPQGFNGLRDSDGDVAGMVGLQQGKPITDALCPDKVMSGTSSVYSDQQ